MALALDTSAQNVVASPFYDAKGALMYNVIFSPKQIEALRIKSLDAEQCIDNTITMQQELQVCSRLNENRARTIDQLTYNNHLLDSMNYNLNNEVALKNKILINKNAALETDGLEITRLQKKVDRTWLKVAIGILGGGAVGAYFGSR